MMRMDRRHLSMGLLALALVAPGCATPRVQPLPADCPDIAETGRLNILTLNGLYDAPAAIRAKGWTDIAQFAVANNVHVLLLQEAVLTDVDRLQELLGTSDSARDFQRILNERSAEPYGLRVAWESGVPFVLSTANAMLSRCNITRHFAAFLPIESEEVFEGVTLKITRNVQVAQLNIPGYGNLNIYNTHLCSACATEALQQQVDALLAFMQQVEGKSSGNHLILGGDFNLDLAKGLPEQAVYETMTRAGLREIYAGYRRTQFGEAPEALCRQGVADVHCTIGTTPVQGLFDSRTGAALPKPQRIDYLFMSGTDTVTTSSVVFNPGNGATGPINPTEPSVSDHSGVFAQITLNR
jgi:maltose 6'-phosphate phosphatase